MSQPWLWHVHHAHTSQQLSGCQVLHHGQGSQPPLPELVHSSPLLPLSPIGYATYIHPPLRGKWLPSAWHEENGEPRCWSLLSPSCRPTARKALHFSSPLGQAVLLLESMRESSVWGGGRGAALPLPERRARAEGLASQLLQGSERPSGQAPRAP